MTLSEQQLQEAAKYFLESREDVYLPSKGITVPSPDAALFCAEPQNALRSAIASADNGLWVAHSVNRLLKTSRGKAIKGPFAYPAQDSFRSAVLFAGAGLDRVLKRLVEQSLPQLVEFDEASAGCLRKYAEGAMTDSQTGGVNARELVGILLSTGLTPREQMTASWIRTLALALQDRHGLSACK